MHPLPPKHLYFPIQYGIQVVFGNDTLPNNELLDSFTEPQLYAFPGIM